MKIASAGAGAMGCRFVYVLLEAGHDVTHIDSCQEHVDAIRRKGLFVVTETTQRYYPIPVMLADESQGEFELVILFSKAMQLDSMLQRIKPLLPAAKVVMILSNGLGNIEPLVEYFDRHN
ncbi:2-dehydropantoate 2-reductase N-terminal domain-containing protein, partial [Salmonella enterica]|uniref:2-dehydropantoate 2-reductase N-terminal domain-containing protein n=1 Tax=Salmonella enterica TaxID=28901 RepID=UPI000B1A84A8